MKVILFGSSGMVGRGVLQECLKATDVERVIAVVRSTTGLVHSKLKEIVLADFTDFSALKSELHDFDACFFCLGVSAAGMDEQSYSKVTYGYTIAAAKVLSELNSRMTFIYVSGAGTDSSEKGKSMWARVKGKTENELLRLPFRNVYLFRPGLIRPMGNIQSKTRSYRIFYSMLRPVLKMLQSFFPEHIASTETMGLSMLELVRNGKQSAVIHPKDIYYWAALARKHS